MGTPSVTTSVVLVTHNRWRFLRRCLEALEQTLSRGVQIVLWNNGSTDETPEGLHAWLRRLRGAGHGLADAVRIVHHPENIGVDAYGRAMRLAQGRYLVILDDDVIALPAGWIPKMIRAFEKVPQLGFLALDVVQDEKTDGGKPETASYRRMDCGDGVVVDVGPAGGWCAMTLREIYRAVGGFPELGRPYYHHDGVFSERLWAAGYITGILVGVRAYHACGASWSRELGYADEQRRKEVQRVLLEGDLARRDWRFQEALAAFEKALRLDPTTPGIHERLADCHFMLEHYDQAAGHLRLAVAENPDSDRVLYIRGLMALREARLEEAMASFQRLARRNPGSLWTQEMLSRVQLYLVERQRSCAGEANGGFAMSLGRNCRSFPGADDGRPQ